MDKDLEMYIKTHKSYARGGDLESQWDSIDEHKKAKNNLAKGMKEHELPYWGGKK